MGEKSRNTASERFLRSASLCLGQRHRSLRQPEGHLHGLVEIDSSRECSTDLFPLPRRGIQDAQAAVAVGLERTHALCLGQGEGLAVVGCGLLGFWWGMASSDLAEEAEGIRLVATLLALAGKGEGLYGMGYAPPPGGQPAERLPPHG
jgi:hypothetical protein